MASVTPSSSERLLAHACAAWCAASTVRVATPLPDAVAQALAAMPDVTIVETDEAEVTVAVSADGAPLDPAVANVVARAAEALGRIVVDTVADDPLIDQLSIDASWPVTVWHRSNHVCAALLPASGDDARPSITLFGPLRRPGQHSGRVTILTGDGSWEGVALVEDAVEHQVGDRDRRIETLERENRLLAEQRIGVHDAAASRAAAATTELRIARTRLGELEVQLEEAIASARQNDEMFQTARADLLAATARARQLEHVVAAHQVNLRGWVRWRAARVLRWIGKR